MQIKQTSTPQRHYLIGIKCSLARLVARKHLTRFREKVKCSFVVLNSFIIYQVKTKEITTLKVWIPGLN